MTHLFNYLFKWDRRSTHSRDITSSVVIVPTEWESLQEDWVVVKNEDEESARAEFQPTISDESDSMEEQTSQQQQTLSSIPPAATGVVETPPLPPPPPPPPPPPSPFNNNPQELRPNFGLQLHRRQSQRLTNEFLGIQAKKSRHLPAQNNYKHQKLRLKVPKVYKPRKTFAKPREKRDRRRS